MSANKSKILVPLDFSEQSLIALEQSYNLAKNSDAEIVLLYVVEELNPVVKILYKDLGDIEQAVERNLKNLADDKAKDTNLKFSTVVRKGRIYTQIAKVAQEIDASFIVMGKTGRYKSKHIGTNTLRVVKTAPCPVITIKGKDHHDGCGNIVLPLDLTKETSDKVNKAIEIAKVFNAKIYVVSILLTSKKEVMFKLEDQLLTVERHIKKEGVPCSIEFVRIIKGETTLAKALIDYSEKVKADLILVMTQQEKDFKDYFIGSRAQEVINSSEIPVLSILPSSRDRIAPVE